MAIITPKIAAITPTSAPKIPAATPNNVAPIENQIGNVIISMMATNMVEEDEALRVVIA